MTKPPPRNLTPVLCEHIRKEMQRACETIAQGQGLVVKASELREVNLRHGFKFALEVSIPLPDGTIFEPGRAIFEILAADYGLSPTDFGREFSANGERFEITGLSPRRPKYPIDAERLPDRNQYKFTAENVALYLRSSAS